MPITISDTRIAQVTDVIQKWVSAFTPWTEQNTPEDFLGLLDPEIKWYDHGFHIVRVGHQAILGLHKTFLHCNQPFRTEIKSLLPTQDGAAVEQLWIGTCKNDIVRPDGTIVMKGSGREFKTHVGFFAKISEEGKITRIDEYDHRYWDEGKEESEYTTINSGGKM